MTEGIVIRLYPQDTVLIAEAGAPLGDLLFEHGVEFPCGGEGRCGGCRVRAVAGDLPVVDKDRAALGEEELAAGWRLACQARATVDVTLEVAQWAGLVLTDQTPFAFDPQEGLGIAVDVGTTTLAAQLLDRRTARVLGVATGLNPQARHGADIMSRLQFASTPAGSEQLATEVRRAAGLLVQTLTSGAAAEPADLQRITLVGNTAMHHLFCGIPTAPVREYPFRPLNGGAQLLKGPDLDWRIGHAPVLFLPCLGGLVGSDILAGILATRIHESEAFAALLDLGTNGEVVVGGRDGLWCASTAAGPAFEGARISMGMRAAAGAVDRVDIRHGRPHCHVLGTASPRGLCGSGLVDAVAAGLDLGVITPSGRFRNNALNWRLCPPVLLSQKDIRELQLAKAAVAAGLQLLRRQGASHNAPLQRVHLAGAFGNQIRGPSARRIGLVDCPSERVEGVGNTALLGAKLALFTPDIEQAAFPDVVARVTHIALAEHPAFTDEFVAALPFPES